MAKNVIINVKIDTKDGVKSIGAVNKEVSTTLTTMRDMEEASALINEQLRGTEVGTAAYKDLSKQLIKVNTELKNQELSLEALDHEQVAGELKSVAGGLTDMAGGLVLVGVSNENMEKVVQTMAKVEGATKIVTGGIEAFQSAMKLSSTATKVATSVQRVFNIVLAANPIGLIVTGIALLIAGFIAFKDPIIDFISNWENLKLIMLAMLGPIGWIIIAYQKLFGEEARAANAREKAAAEQRAREKKAIDDIQATIKENKKASEEFIKGKQKEIEVNEQKIKILENEGKSSFALRLQILEDNVAIKQSNLDTITFFINGKIEQYKTLAKLRGQSDEEFKAQMLAQGINLDDLSDQAIEAQERLQLSIQVAESEITKIKREENEKRVSDNKSAQDKIDADNKKTFDEELKRLEELNKIRFKKADDLFNRRVSARDELKKLQAQESNDLFALLDYEHQQTIAKLDENIPEEKALLLFYEEKYLKDKAALTKEFDEEADATTKKWSNDRKDELMSTFGEIAGHVDMVFGFINQGLDLFNQAMDQRAEQRKVALEKEFAAESEALTASLANRELSQKEYDIRLKAAEDRKKEQEKQERLKAFKREKAMNIVGAVMSGAQSVLQALASSPPPLSFILAGINAALSAVQIGIISSQKFTGARGGVVPGSGPSHIDSVDAMLAPGEMVINAQSASMFPQLLSSLNQAGGGISLAPESTISQPTLGQNEPIYRENRKDTVIKAYVVEQDMTDAQRRIKRIEDSATF